MTDTVIKGTGNSRTIKGATTVPATWEAARTQLISQGWPVDLTGPNAAGCEVVGTALNKANLLTDALCTALGLAATATPTEAMDKLRQLIATAQSSANAKTKIEFGNYIGNGKYGISNPNSLSFSFTPRVVFVAAEESGMTMTAVNSSAFAYALASTIRGDTLIWTENTVSWYTSLDGTGAPGAQLNVSGKTYYYVAIG